MDSQRKTELLRLIVVAGCLFATAFHYTLGSLPGYEGYPHNTFLFRPDDRFHDFLNISWATSGLDPYSSAVSVYLPFTYLPIYMLTFLDDTFALAIFSAVFVICLAYYVYRNVPCTDGRDRLLSIFTLVFMAYPVLFCLDRGNLEMLLFVFVALSISAYRKGDGFMSACWLSLATAMKIYPAVFCMLYLADRKYRHALVTVVLAVLLTFASGAVLNGGITASIEGFRNNLELFKSMYLNDHISLHFSNSLFNLLALGGDAFPLLRGVAAGYRYLAVALIAGIAAYVMFFERLFWKRVSLLVFMVLLVPAISYDYKLILLFVPLMLFLREAEPSRFDGVYVALFGLLLVPKHYYHLFADVSISVLLNPLIIVTMAVLMVIDRRRRATA